MYITGDRGGGQIDPPLGVGRLKKVGLNRVKPRLGLLYLCFTKPILLYSTFSRTQFVYCLVVQVMTGKFRNQFSSQISYI